ncbi:MAG: hypothetical protein IE885_04045 [Campylobacterales bacterium]|nr:hypothetical protein [Campylobacterales bacterium]
MKKVIVAILLGIGLLSMTGCTESSQKSDTPAGKCESGKCQAGKCESGKCDFGKNASEKNNTN